MVKPPNFIFLGLSGSGKGTQEELLQKALAPKFKMKIISTGKLFRELQEKDTAAGRRVKEILDKGGLPPEELAVMLWMHQAVFHVMEDEGIIFDGTPRRLLEAVNVDKFLQFVERKDNTKVIYLHVSPQEVARRLLLRKRGDDLPEAIQARIEYFYNEVMQTIEYFRQQGNLIEINGEQDVEKVHQDIRKSIEVV